MTTTTATRRNNRQPSYLKVFADRTRAADWCKMLNTTNRLPRHRWVLVNHTDGAAVVDPRSAIVAGRGYQFFAV